MVPFENWIETTLGRTSAATLATLPVGRAELVLAVDAVDVFVVVAELSSLVAMTTPSAYACAERGRQGCDDGNGSETRPGLAGLRRRRCRGSGRLGWIRLEVRWGRGVQGSK